MSVQRGDVEAVASLARLRLDEDDLEHLTRDLNAILEHVDALMSLEAVDGSEAAVEPGPVDRSGAAGEPGPAELASTRDPAAETPDALAGGAGAAAPEWRDGFFLVPAPPGVQHGGSE